MREPPALCDLGQGTSVEKFVTLLLMSVLIIMSISTSLIGMVRARCLRSRVKPSGAPGPGSRMGLIRVGLKPPLFEIHVFRLVTEEFP